MGKTILVDNKSIICTVFCDVFELNIMLLSCCVDDLSFTSFVLEFCSYYKLVVAPFSTVQKNKALSIYSMAYKMKHTEIILFTA